MGYLEKGPKHDFSSVPLKQDSSSFELSSELDLQSNRGWLSLYWRYWGFFSSPAIGDLLSHALATCCHSLCLAPRTPF